MSDVKNKSLLIFISLSFVYLGILISLEGMINKSLSLYFGYSLSYFVAVDGLIFVTSVIFNVAYRYIAKIIEIKSILLISYVIFIVLLLLIFISVNIKDIILYSMSVILLGIPIGIFYPAMNEGLYLISNNRNQHFRITCFENALWSIGFFIGAVIVNFIIELIDFKFVYIFMSIMSLIYFILLFFKIKNQARLNDTNKERLNRANGRFQFSGRTIILFLGLAFMALTSFQSLFEYWMPNYIKSISLINPEFYGVIIGAYGIGQFITRLYFSVKFSLKNTLSSLILKLYILLTLSASLLFFSESELILIAICFLLGVFSGPLFPAIIADGMSIQTGNGSEKTVSTLIAFMTAGFILSVWCSSWFFYEINLQYICTLLFILVLIGLILYSIKSYLSRTN